MMYVLVVWVWLAGTGTPVKVAAYENHALCFEAAEMFKREFPRGNRAICLPIESRSSVVETVR